MFYNQTIQDVENDLIAYRARNLLKQPEHPGETMAEYRDRKRHHKVWAVAAGVLALVSLCVGLYLS